jgi:DNA repair protein RadC
MSQTTLDLNGKGYAPSDNQPKEIACGERPQNRLEAFGAGALSDTELLALILNGVGRVNEVLDLASRLIAEAGSIRALLFWKEGDFLRLRGIGRTRAAQLIAVLEIGRRLNRADEEKPLLTRADLAAAYLAPLTGSLEVEKFWVFCLNRKNRLLKLVEVTSGTATAALAHPREVFRAAIRESAAAVICAHNHPSGVLLSGKKIRICRIRPQRGRVWFGFYPSGIGLGYEGLVDRKQINKWEGCRGGAAGPFPLVNWGEETRPTGDMSHLNFSPPIRSASADSHSNMNLALEKGAAKRTRAPVAMIEECWELPIETLRRP